MFNSTLVYGRKAICYLANKSVEDWLINTVGKQRRKTCDNSIFRPITIRFVWNTVYTCTVHGINEVEQWYVRHNYFYRLIT